MMNFMLKFTCIILSCQSTLEGLDQLQTFNNNNGKKGRKERKSNEGSKEGRKEARKQAIKEERK